MQRFFALYVFLFISTLLPTSTVVFAEAVHSSASEPVSSSPAKPVILVWGDSLSAAYGIPVAQGWVSLLREQLKDSHEVINGSISGETTVGGLTRLPDALELHEPDYVLLELGANDGLRGLSLDRMQENLNKMIELSLEAKAKPILLGIKIPPNYGMVYTDKFDKVFSDLAEKHALPLQPFLLAGVATDYSLMQADGLHPTAQAQPKVLENVWLVLKPVLAGVDAVDTAEASEASEAPAVAESAIAGQD